MVSDELRRTRVADWLRENDLKLWVNPTYIQKRPQAEYSQEDLLSRIVDYYVKVQLERPEELEERLRSAWKKVLEGKPELALEEEAEKLGIL